MNRGKMWLSLCLLVLVPCILFAQDGKLRGRVTDKDSGEPLIGASVQVDGTTLGASADLNGDYVILSVPPGVYTVKVSYIGYQALSVSNVRVSANLTTTQDYQLKTSDVQADAVEVVAERPLVQRNTTNTVRLTTSEDIQSLPIRGVQNILALSAGTVQQNGNLHIRGGRAGEVAFFVDGATAINPFNNAENATVIQEAIEEMQLQSGGYTAEFGGANSGVVRTTVKTGSQDFHASIDYRTDDFAKPGEQFLNTSSFGFRNGVVTLSGPIMSKLKFFAAGQHNYFRNRTLRYIDAFRFDSLKTDVNDGRTVKGIDLPGSVAFEENALPRNYRLDNSFNGTLTYDLSNALKFRLTGTYGKVENLAGTNWPGALANVFQIRLPKQETLNLLGNFKVTHVLNPTTFYEAAVSYSNRDAKQFDEGFGDNYLLYRDSTANANAGYGEFLSRYEAPRGYSTINAFTFNHPNNITNGYFKNSQSNLGFSLDLTSQVSKRWEIKVGGRMDRWTMRQFNVNDITGLLTYLNGKDGTSVRTFASELERKVRIARAGAIDAFGYDSDGNKVNSGADGPRHPLFAAFYVQNKLEYRDLVVNLGMRYERISTDALAPTNLENPAFNSDLNYVDESQLTTSEASDYFLPRVNFSFPVTDRTVFYATYGKYVQLAQLTDVFTGNRNLSESISPVTRSPYGSGRQYAGFTAKPERTTQYEMGIRQSLSDNFALTITGFYKDLLDQLRWDRVVADGTQDIPAGSTILSGLLNRDFGTVKGLEMTLELRRTKRLSAKVNYTLSDARGTGSDSRSTRVAVSDGSTRYPVLTYPLNFNQSHRGSIILDYRFAKNEGGSILQGTGLNAIMTFNSGHAYTQISEISTLGQASPWNIGVYPLQDARFRVPTEPINSSATPFNFNIDLNLSRQVTLSKINAEVYVNVLNLLDSKNITNVYPNTGTAEDDGWLRNPLSNSFVDIPQYADFYRAINEANRWAYSNATGLDLYGQPRQIRLGLKLEL